MLEYAGKIRDVTDSLEKEKQSRLADLRKDLASERKRRRRELYKKHCREAQQAGLDPDEVKFLISFLFLLFLTFLVSNRWSVTLQKKVRMKLIKICSS